MSKNHRNKNKHTEEEGGEAWLLPYSDLMTLLLAVFIVLFAVSKVDEVKVKEMAASFGHNMMSGGEGALTGEGDTILPAFPEVIDEEQKQEENDSNSEKKEASEEELKKFLGQYEFSNLEQVKSKLDEMFKKEELMSDITVRLDLRGLVISLNNAILFDSGSAEIKVENEETLLKLAKTINTLNNYIRIEGHTDNVPIRTSDYPSNWELSTARASSVVRLFIDECNVSPEKIVAVGYGEYKPIANNATEIGREKNRRIDIILLSQKYNNLEDQNAQ